MPILLCFWSILISSFKSHVSTIEGFLNVTNLKDQNFNFRIKNDSNIDNHNNNDDYNNNNNNKSKDNDNNNNTDR